MNARLEALFHEVADLSAEARASYFAAHTVDDETRRELEALLAFDSGSSAFLVRDIADGAARALTQLDANGSRCGPYRLLEVIGRGGMGTVYLAERVDGEVTQRVAVKLLPPGASDPLRDRFLQERQILASLVHPNIARLLDAGHLEDSRPFLAMEYIEGQPIDRFADGFSARQKVTLFLKVCAAVGYLHRNLIIHRDLKPNNILVTADGEPKLLDFGIAKILDLATDATVTGIRMLTPDYASPEQMRGVVVSTSTDVYSLGAVLYKLLAGRSPHESPEGTARPIDLITGVLEIPPASRLDPAVPKDLDYVLRKALRIEPQERYVSVEALANDLRAFLEFRPVDGRSGDAWYRMRRFVRRYWVPVAACAITIAGLSLGLFAANRQRTLAQRRFQQVRHLANKVIALGDLIEPVPGTTKARHEIVAITKEYLEALAPEARYDRDLALEIGMAYSTLAAAQGVPGEQNLGQYTQAEESLRKAEALVEPIVMVFPRERVPLIELAQICRRRMALAWQLGRPKEEILAHARKTVSCIDTLLGIGPLSDADKKNAAALLYSIALSYRNLHLHQEAIRYASRSTELGRSLSAGVVESLSAPSLLADLKRISGDSEGALEAIREARTILERRSPPANRSGMNARFNVLWREGVILGGGGGLNVNRPDDAVVVLQQAFDLIEEFARKDPNDAAVRILFDQAARELGGILREREPQRALAVYDLAILRLREVKNNARARRGEAGLLAGSSYALRRLNRIGEAKERIDTALGLLRETKDYPAGRIDTDSEAEPALRALADHYTDTGQPRRGAEVYQELLDKLLASKPDPQNDLRHATKLSRIYQALANLHRQNRHPDRADAVAGVRLELWRQWADKLPANDFVRRQLEAARQ